MSDRSYHITKLSEVTALFARMTGEALTKVANAIPKNGSLFQQKTSGNGEGHAWRQGPKSMILPAKKDSDIAVTQKEEATYSPRK